METLLRCIDYAFDFIWMISPVVMLAVFTWRLSR